MIDAVEPVASGEMDIRMVCVRIYQLLEVDYILFISQHGASCCCKDASILLNDIRISIVVPQYFVYALDVKSLFLCILA